jgi:hypothetical protein
MVTSPAPCAPRLVEDEAADPTNAQYLVCVTTRVENSIGLGGGTAHTIGKFVDACTHHASTSLR